MTRTSGPRPEEPESHPADVLDLAALQTWFKEHGQEPSGPLTVSQITGGRSNLTFLVADGSGRRWVLRRPPLGLIMAGAHDVAREARVVQSLAGAVPVAAVVGTGEDADGRPFYVMHEVPGLVVRTAADAVDLDTAARNRCGVELMRELARLHSLDPAAVGLGSFGRGTDYLNRQITAWQRMGDQYRSEPWPQADRVRDLLLATAPDQEHTSLLHGDYRLDNVLLDRTGAIQAVLDWELCTRGDPFVDVAVCLYYWTDRSDPVQPFAEPPTVEPGFADRSGLLAAYIAAGGRPLPRPNYYLGYAAWRLALVLEGVLGRFRSGAYGSSDPAEERRLAETIRGLVAHAQDLLHRPEAAA